MTRELHKDLDEAADFSHWRIPAASARKFVVHSNRVNFREASRAYKWRTNSKPLANISDWSQVNAHRGKEEVVPRTSARSDKDREIYIDGGWG